MKLKPLKFEKVATWRWIAESPCGYYVIDFNEDSDDPYYNCYLEREITLCPNDSISGGRTLKTAIAECQKHFEKLLKPYIQE